jgi:hypothetical protein
MIQLALQLGVAKLAELCIDGTRVLAAASRFRTLTAEKAERLLNGPQGPRVKPPALPLAARRAAWSRTTGPRRGAGK